MRYEWIIRGFCSAEKDIPTGASVIFVNGKEVIDYCEGCGKRILDGDESYTESEGQATLCPKCYKELLQEATDDRS